jgi:hypothetical protein
MFGFETGIDGSEHKGVSMTAWALRGSASATARNLKVERPERASVILKYRSVYELSQLLRSRNPGNVDLVLPGDAPVYAIAVIRPTE